ncbi:MAG: endonuclease/exonuclease/phosphatase family protein [Planctomycetota bacterium]
MNLRYTIATVLCLGLSVPLMLHLASRRADARVPSVRFATFNLALNRPGAGDLLQELRGGGSEPARRLAEIVQRTRPDVVLLQELDRDDAAESAAVFVAEYLGVSQNQLDPLDYPFRYCGPVNTGEPSGLDLDRDGAAGGPGDAFGYGAFPGQYGMVLLSRYPILEDRVRSFQKLPWRAMPAAKRPVDWYSDEAWNALRLSSKSHWDVPIGFGAPGEGRVVHVLCSHPTPPVFDGPEDRNGCRNHDEIRFWVDYLTPEAAQWIEDDRGGRGGLAAGESFVVMGDLNCDPQDGDAQREALLALLAHARLQDPQPRSIGGDKAKIGQFGVNMQHLGDPALDTGDFPDAPPGRPDSGPGNLRVDYVLPSRDLRVIAAQVFWPAPHEQTAALAQVSDHRLVAVDVAMP